MATADDNLGSAPLTLDRFTIEHFYKWLEITVDYRDRPHVERLIFDLLRGDPLLLEGRSWPELRALAEGANDQHDTRRIK